MRSVIFGILFFAIPLAGFSQGKSLYIEIPHEWEYHGKFKMRLFTDSEGGVYSAFRIGYREGDSTPKYVIDFFIKKFKGYKFVNPELSNKRITISIEVPPKSGTNSIGRGRDLSLPYLTEKKT